MLILERKQLKDRGGSESPEFSLRDGGRAGARVHVPRLQFNMSLFTVLLLPTSFIQRGGQTEIYFFFIQQIFIDRCVGRILMEPQDSWTPCALTSSSCSVRH